ncbi:E3 ubiquitin-protein ligase BOI-like [Vicia villosa]|uniref:E3 ubiquitin-protein ligase BOI-like n=1 Tax=Vicia villosa TaxID=3911 RepID=UPI00273B547F|nr:E3 ubiquitin-protein ligase BOI-like [Vicia villosa]
MRSNQPFYDMAMPMQPSTMKRLRNSTTESNTLQPQPQPQPQQKFQLPNQSNFLDQSILHLRNSQQSEINSLIAQHTENLRTEIHKLTMKQARMLQCVIHDSMVKKLKQKDEAIEDLANVQLMLQERVKTLISENQIWREMAMTNETTVNSLRIELEKVMQDSESHQQRNGCDDAEEAESSCRSNCHVEVEKKVAGKWMCKQCGVNRSELLLLPCRHLCLCTVCGSGILNCPLCASAVNASVQVNFC